jgi:hypothetical protein
MATEIMGGSLLAMPHQAAAIKLGLSSTFAPIKNVGIGEIKILGPIRILPIGFLL